MRVEDEDARLAVFQSWARAGHGRAGPIIPSVLRGGRCCWEELAWPISLDSGPSKRTCPRSSPSLSPASAHSSSLFLPFSTDPRMTAERQPLLPRRRRQTLSPHTLTRPLLLLTLADALLESAAYARLHVLTTCQTVRPTCIPSSLSLPKSLMSIEIFNLLSFFPLAHREIRKIPPPTLLALRSSAQR